MGSGQEQVNWLKLMLPSLIAIRQVFYYVQINEKVCQLAHKNRIFQGQRNLQAKQRSIVLKSCLKYENRV